MTTESGIGAELDLFEFRLRYPTAHAGKRRRSLAAGSIKAYRDTVNRFLHTLDGGPLDEEIAIEFVKMLEEDGNGARSIARHIYALRTYYEFKDAELQMGPPRFRRPVPRFINRDEWDRMVDVASAPLYVKGNQAARRKAVFRMAALMVYGGAGLRLAEGCGLTRQDLRPDGTLIVRGKGQREDILPIHDAVVAAIQDQLKRHKSNWVFPNPSGAGPIRPRTMQAAITELAEAAELKDIRRMVHALRHHAGTDMHQRGVPLLDLQSLMRHADPSTTQLYVHMSNPELRKQVGKRNLDWRQSRMPLVG